MLPTQQKLFQMNRISQNLCYRSRQVALAWAILKSGGIIFELLWIERVPLSLGKDLDIFSHSLIHKLQILFWWLSHTSAAEPAHPQSRTFSSTPILTSGHWLHCFIINSLYLHKLTQKKSDPGVVSSGNFPLQEAVSSWCRFLLQTTPWLIRIGCRDRSSLIIQCLSGLFPLLAICNSASHLPEEQTAQMWSCPNDSEFEHSDLVQAESFLKWLKTENYRPVRLAWISRKTTGTDNKATGKTLEFKTMLWLYRNVAVRALF